jgi:hypothetical protein
VLACAISDESGRSHESVGSGSSWECLDAYVDTGVFGVLRLREFIRKANELISLRMTDGEMSSRLLRLHLREQLLNPVLFLKRGQAVLDVFVAQFGLRLADGFVVRDFSLHAVEGSGL